MLFWEPNACRVGSMFELEKNIKKADMSTLIIAIITLDQTNLERQRCNTNTCVNTVLKIRIESLFIW